MTLTPKNDPRSGILKTGTTISDSPSWLDSLLRQIVELRDEKKHPRQQVEITAQRDPSARNNLVEMPSPILSLVSDIREEIWSKPKTGLPRLLSILVHVVVVTLAIVPWATSLRKNPITETAVMVYRPVNLIMPVQADDKSGGGGGGGRKTITPPSLGKLPRPADKQFTPPDPEPPKNPDPKLIVEPTVVAPQLAQLPQINLLNLGDPSGIQGPPSAGPGVGGGIGTGQGRGVGEGKGPGVGPGEGGRNIRKKRAKPAIRERLFSKRSFAGTARSISSASCAALGSASTRTLSKP